MRQKNASPSGLANTIPLPEAGSGNSPFVSGWLGAGVGLGGGGSEVEGGGVEWGGDAEEAKGGVEDVLVGDGEARVGTEALEGGGEVGVEAGELGGVEEEHADFAAVGCVVSVGVLAEEGAPPAAVMAEVFAVVADVEVDEGATFQQGGDAAEELIGVVDGVVVGVVDLLSLGSGVLEVGSGGGKGWVLEVVVAEGGVAALVIDEEEEVAAGALLLQDALHLVDSGPGVAGGVEASLGAAGQDAHDAVILELLGTAAAKEGVDGEVVLGKEVDDGAGGGLHAGGLVEDAAAAVGEDGNLGLTGVAGSGDAGGEVDELLAAGGQEGGGGSRVAVDGHAVGADALADVEDEDDALAPAEGGDGGEGIGGGAQALYLVDGGFVDGEGFGNGGHELGYFAGGPVVVDGLPRRAQA